MKECKLIIKDEVNVKLEGLDLGDRKTLMKMFEYEKPGARYLPSVRLGRWNGKVSYFSLGGSTYVNLLPDILPLLDEAGYDIQLEDLREYAFKHGKPKQTSGRQEWLENIINQYI